MVEIEFLQIGWRMKTQYNKDEAFIFKKYGN